MIYLTSQHVSNTVPEKLRPILQQLQLSNVAFGRQSLPEVLLKGVWYNNEIVLNHRPTLSKQCLASSWNVFQSLVKLRFLSSQNCFSIKRIRCSMAVLSFLVSYTGSIFPKSCTISLVSLPLRFELICNFVFHSQPGLINKLLK